MKVSILAYLPGVEELVAKIAWASISGLPPPEISVGEADVARLFRLARTMKLSSVLDFPFYIFSISGVSRVFTHQWVRYRIAAHIQQSMRWVKIDTGFDPEDPWFIVPPSIVKQGADAVVMYVKGVIEAGRRYLELVDEGVPTEDARFVLPHAVKTHISTVMNAEELLHVIEQRTCFDAQWEIRAVAYVLLAGLYALSPRIFRNAGPYCVWEGVCRGRGRGRCLNEAKSLTRKALEAGERARKMLEESGYNRSVVLDLTDLFGFKAEPELKATVGEMIGLDKPVNLDYPAILEIKSLSEVLDTN